MNSFPMEVSSPDSDISITYNFTIIIFDKQSRGEAFKLLIIGIY